MKHTICNQVRFEIDEKDLTAALSATAMEHLRHCHECQEFQSKETKLRQIVGSLETVNAPADFDFRLRARLANDGTAAGYLSMSPVRVWRLRSAAVAAMLLIFAATVYMIRQNQSIPTTPGSDSATKVADDTPRANPIESPTTTPGLATARHEESNGRPEEKRINRPRQLSAASKRPVAVWDPASKSAPVINTDQDTATITTFPLTVSQPSFKVSLDDGHGTSRTISVPSVSFGSRRVLNNAVSTNQYAPKGDW
jgi:hypothetical protein